MRKTYHRYLAALSFLAILICTVVSSPIQDAAASEAKSHSGYDGKRPFDWRRFRDSRRLDRGIASGVAGGVAGQIAGEAINDAIVRGYEENLIDRSRPRSRVNIDRGDQQLGLNDRHYNWCYNTYRSYDIRSNTYINADGVRLPCISQQEYMDK